MITDPSELERQACHCSQARGSKEEYTRSLTKRVTSSVSAYPPEACDTCLIVVAVPISDPSMRT